MWGLKLSILILTLIFILTTNVQAHEFNITDGRGFLLFPETGLSEPLNPKISCKPDGSHCLMLVYQNNSFFGQGVNVWFSTNFFTVGLGTRQVTNIGQTNFTTYGTGFYDIFNFPYDVQWNSATNQYYFFVEETIYTYDGITLFVQGNFTSGQTVVGLGFQDENVISAVLSADVGNPNPILKMKGFASKCGASLRATSSGISTDNKDFNAYWVNGSLKESIETICDATDCSYNSSFFDPGNFTSNFGGLFYQLGNKIVYPSGNNVVSLETNDACTTYGSETNVYTLNALIEESINNSDASELDRKIMYSYRRDSNDTSLNGVWVYNLPVTEVRFLMEGFDPALRTTELVNITASLNCSSETWEDSDVGQNARVNTPCQDENELRIESFTFRPNVFSFGNYTIPNNCIGLSNIVRTSLTKGYYKPYDFTITYFDSIFGNRIDGVTSTLNSDINTSDIDGQVIFNTFPIINENFTVSQNTEACTTFLEFTGVSKQYTHIATKSGYTSFSESFIIATPPFDVETDFETQRNVFLTPLNTEVEIHLFSKDGIELFPTGALTILLEGSNVTFLKLNNELFETNIATNVPANLLLINNTGTFDINISLNYFGEYNETVTVSTNQFKRVDIFINQSSWELPCNTLADCSGDLCSGQFYKTLLACTSNQCEYQTTDCLTTSRCDLLLGCVDLVSLTNCTVDGDCTNACADTTRMLNNKCGDNGFCKSTFVTCQQDCNQTLGYCGELEQCLNKNERTFRGGFINPTTGFFNGGTVFAFCDFSNVEQYTCGFPDNLLIRSADLTALGLTIQRDVIVDPDGWPAKAVTLPVDGYELYALSIFCTETCNMTWDFCEFGCDINTGRCKGIAKTIDDSFGVGGISNNLIEGFWNFYDLIFPDIHSQSFMWLVAGIIFLLCINAINLGMIPKVPKSTISIKTEWDVIFILIWIFIGSLITTSIPGVTRFYNFAWITLTVLAIVYFVNWVRVKQSGGD